jgi:DNA-binding beta-propeller fold protein YncE
MQGADRVSGVTLLDNKLFVLREQNENQLQVYDTTNYSLLHQLMVKGLQTDGRNDITSCQHNRCLYISDYYGVCIHRLDLKGRPTKWSVKDTPTGLSVSTDDHYLLVTCLNVRKLKEFTTFGKQLREINLQPDMASPCHAVQLSTPSRFVVCHGTWGTFLHRVCIVDSTSSSIMQSFGDQSGSAINQLKWPRHLAVDADGSVFVADSLNDKVLLLSPTLTYVRDVVTRELWGPCRLCLDVDRRLLYIGQLGGRLTITQL